MRIRLNKNSQEKTLIEIDPRNEKFRLVFAPLVSVLIYHPQGKEELPPVVFASFFKRITSKDELIYNAGLRVAEVINQQLKTANICQVFKSLKQRPVVKGFTLEFLAA